MSRDLIGNKFVNWEGGLRSTEDASHPAAPGSNLLRVKFVNKAHLVQSNGFHNCT